MMKEIESILNETDDGFLCDGVFCRFADLDNSLHADQYEEVEQVITLVWHSAGIIGNGGFHYLFEGDFNGDPGFFLTAKAFASIGAEGANKAFKEIMNYFPQGLPSDIGKRLKIYENIPEEEARRIDMLFWDNRKNIETKLAEYIRLNREEVSRLLVGAKSN